jgi:SAM-dependent methyltransferase
VKGYGDASYGDSFDETFEATHSRLLPDPTPMVDMLARYAGGSGPALELGVGTGRVARPLAERGVEVDGIEISPVLAEQLRQSTKGLPVEVFLGSFGDVPPPRSYRLIYCVWNTFFYLTTKEEQIKALGPIAGALDPGGVCVMEAYVPDPRRFSRGQEMKVIELAADSVTLQFALHDPDTQIIESQRVALGRDGIRFHPTVNRYVSPDQLEEMAAEVGLRLRNRWAGWNEEPFTEDSTRHVSVFEVA